MIPYEPTMGRWSPLQPPVMAALLADVNTPWWVAGGWALDLFLGFQTRSHDDLDVGILRRDVAAVIANLPGWELFEAKSAGALSLGRLRKSAPRGEFALVSPIQRHELVIRADAR